MELTVRPTELNLDFVILGAPKSATTWLVTALSQHPDVFLPPGEYHYFSGFYDSENPLPSAYAELFLNGYKGEGKVGERSNSYLANPEVPARLFSHFPDAKLFAILREPAMRAYSHYCMRYRLGENEGTIQECLDPETSTDHGYLREGRYAESIKRYVDLFGRDAVQLILFDDIRQNPAQVFKDACVFLNVDENFVPDLLTTPQNTRNEKRARPALRNLVLENKLTRDFGLRFRNTRFYRRFLRPHLVVDVQPPPFPDELRRKLSHYYSEDVKALSSLLGRSLDHWIY